MIISQNYVYRRNVRDYQNFSKPFQNGAPSSQILQELGRTLVRKLSGSGSSNLGLASALGNFDRTENSKLLPSFSLVGIESRVKISKSSRSEVSFTNGTLFFGTGRKLGQIPFILKEGETMEQVIGEGVMANKEDHSSFLELVGGLQADVHEDGRERLGRVRRLSDSLIRPRLPKIKDLLEDHLQKEEATARDTLWLVTTTIGVRTISPKEDGNLEHFPENEAHFGKVTPDKTRLSEYAQNIFLVPAQKRVLLKQPKLVGLGKEIHYVTEGLGHGQQFADLPGAGSGPYFYSTIKEAS